MLQAKGSGIAERDAQDRPYSSDKNERDEKRGLIY
jgi:hypothetical protein